MDFDEAMKAVGEFGFTQKIQQVILNSIQLFGAMHMLSLVFVGREPTSIMCGDHISVYDEVCLMKPPCDDYKYGPEFTSIATEWNLVCEKSHKVGLAQSVYMAGVLLGNLQFGSFSDHYGRLRMTLIGLALLSLLGTLSAMVWTFEQFLVFRFLVGYGAGGVILSVFVLQTENLSSYHRALSATCAPCTFAFGVMLYAVMAYFVRDWRNLLLLSSLPVGAYLFIYFLVPESPRWLITKGRITEAEDILHQIGRKNGMKVSRSMINLAESKTTPKTDKYGLLDCFKTPVLRMRMMILICSWFTASMVYYGLTMNAGNLGSNVYLSVALSGLVELPAYLFCFLVLNRTGRRKAMAASMFVGGVSCLSLLFISKEGGGVFVQPNETYELVLQALPNEIRDGITPIGNSETIPSIAQLPPVDATGKTSLPSSSSVFVDTEKAISTVHQSRRESAVKSTVSSLFVEGPKSQETRQAIKKRKKGKKLKKDSDEVDLLSLNKTLVSTEDRKVVALEGILSTLKDETMVMIRTSLALIGKMGISSAFNIVYIYSSELLPTVLRNSGMGICSMSARIGGIVAPQIIPMGDRATFLIFGGTAFACAIFDLGLPETLNKPLPENIDDVEHYEPTSTRKH